MAAITGKEGRIKITSAAASSSTNNTATLSTDGITLTIDSTAKRHWDKTLSTGLTVFQGAGDVTADLNTAETNYVQGIVYFSTPHSTALSYTIDVDSFTVSHLANARSWSVNPTVDMQDVTVFSTSTADVAWRKKRPGLAEAQVSVERIVVGTSAPAFYDRLNSGQRFVLELHASTRDFWEAFGYVEGDGYTLPVDGTPAENVTFAIDGGLYRTT